MTQGEFDTLMLAKLRQAAREVLALGDDVAIEAFVFGWSVRGDDDLHLGGGGDEDAMRLLVTGIWRGFDATDRAVMIDERAVEAAD